VLVAQHLPKPGAHLATALPHLHVRNLARRSSLEAVNTREKKAVEGGGGDAAAARNKQLGNCTAGKSKYVALCVQWKLNSRGDVLSASWSRRP
jgi:hypothetical protein